MFLTQLFGMHSITFNDIVNILCKQLRNVLNMLLKDLKRLPTSYRIEQQTKLALGPVSKLIKNALS